MMKLAILGSCGMLGSDLAELAPEKGFDVKTYPFPDFDILREDDVLSAVSAADLIVNCAAYTQVDKAESETEIAAKVNADCLEFLGNTIREQNKYLVHISTDFVFGDKSGKALKEEDAPAPLNVYGQTKLEGEKVLAATACDHSIIRVQWTYGKYGENFITKILDLAKKLDSLKVVDDQIGSPTHTLDVSRAICCFLEKRPSGLYHFSSNGFASRFETAKFIFEECGIDISVSPCASSEFKTPAERPLNSRFDCSKIDSVLDFERPFWKDALKDFLNNRMD
jgi:dTDP-4-dehydrorhamnose reductase